MAEEKVLHHLYCDNNYNTFSSTTRTPKNIVDESITITTIIMPPSIIASAIAPFLDCRTTFNNLAMASKEINAILKHLEAPWPEGRPAKPVTALSSDGQAPKI